SWLGGISTLSLPIWSAQNEGSAAWGLGALVVEGGTEIAGDLCVGTCRTAVRAAGLLGYASIAATDIAWLSYREEPAAPRRTMSVEPFITTSPTTGRPRAGASF